MARRTQDRSRKTDATRTTAVAAKGSLAVAIIAGVALAFVGAPPIRAFPSLILFAPVIGIAVGLASRRLWAAAGIAAACTVAGNVLAAAFAKPGMLVSDPLFYATVEAVLSAPLAALAAFLVARIGSVPRHVHVAVALALVVLCGWWSAFSLAHAPDSNGATFIDSVRDLRPITADSFDGVLYAHYAAAVASGAGYYDGAARVVYEANQVRSTPFSLQSPFTLRPPTLYWFLGSLGGSGSSYVIAALLLVSVSAIASFLLAREWVVEPIALVAPALTMFFGSTMGWNWTLFIGEMWSGALALIAGLLIVRSERSGFDDTALAWGAVAVAVLAAVIRETALAFLLLGAVACAVDPQARRRRAWLPWGVGVAVAVAFLAVHSMIAADALRSLPRDAVSGPLGSWFKPDGLGLVAGLSNLAFAMFMVAPAGWLLWLLSAAGTVLAPRRVARMWLAGSVIGGGLLLLAFRTSGVGIESGLPPGYWFDLIAPTVLACVPLAAVVVPGTAISRPDGAADAGASDGRKSRRPSHAGGAPTGATPPEATSQRPSRGRSGSGRRRRA